MAAKIVCLPGDGIGPEVMAEACKVLRAVSQRFNQSIDLVEALIGGAAIDRTGEPLPAATLELCRESDAVLLGAVGGPQWDDPQREVRPEQGLLKIRQSLGLFANLRPIRVFPSLQDAAPLRPEIVRDVDLLIVRELTGGIYFGPRGRSETPNGEHAFDTMVYTTPEVERIVRLAARHAQGRRGRVASVDKANVLAASRLWRATATRVMRDEFPDIELEHVLVDSAAMHLIRNPGRFDVIVTGNMFGDILTDEASVLPGSMGLLPSASLGSSGPGLYEPVHGSAPDIAGRGIANPIGMILCVAMMCRESLGWTEAARCIEIAVDTIIAGGARTPDIAASSESAITTSEMGSRVVNAVAEVETAACCEERR